MVGRVEPVFRRIEEKVLVGTMAVYDSQAEASAGIPLQWRAFLVGRSELGADAEFYGASPCTDDGKIHYMVGVAQASAESVIDGERLTLVAGEYAVVSVKDPALLRETWVWLLRDWLPASGRRERNAPEFERFSGVSDDGKAIGPVEIWIPLES